MDGWLAGGRKLAQPVTYHVLHNGDAQEGLSIVDSDRGADPLGEDH